MGTSLFRPRSICFDTTMPGSSPQIPLTVNARISVREGILLTELGRILQLFDDQTFKIFDKSRFAGNQEEQLEAEAAKVAMKRWPKTVAASL